MRRWWWIGLIITVVGIGLAIYYWPSEWINPKGRITETKELVLEKYDFDNLRKRGGISSEIKILGKIAAVEDRRAAAGKKYSNNFATREIIFESEGKKISGMMNYKNEGWIQGFARTPVIIMIRGYAESVGYYPGSGSWAAADKLAEAGYATISLDFLGYGDSDDESTDILEARFEKVVSVLDLIESVKALPWVDKNRIGIWAHSNGGQIALSVLEITGERYPTVLWAPMTQPFPQSVLSTNDEDSPVRGVIEEFEKYYDARRYAFENYYEWIQAPLLIQQGTADEWCEINWQRDLQSKLNNLGKEAELVVYPGADHNLQGAWQEAVERDIEWLGERI